MRKRRRRWLWAPVVLLALTVSDYWLYPVLARPGGVVVNRGRNSIWLRYTWYFGAHGEQDFQNLADRLRSNGITDAYFHVRSVEPDGRLKYRYLERTRELNTKLRKLAPGVRRIAWIYAGNEHGLGHVRLDNPQVRRQMAHEAAWLVSEGGFEGVQWDYEICPDGDPNLLKLLEETRKALPQGTFLGIAVPTWYPPPLGGVGWSEGYYRQVSRRCDQIAVMTYDTAAYSPRLYVWFVSEQVARITRAVAAENPDCRVILGVPTYEDGTASHNPRAENLRLALLGVRNGLTQADLSVWQGIGLFADYTTDESEWLTWRKLWPQAD